MQSGSTLKFFSDEPTDTEEYIQKTSTLKDEDMKGSHLGLAKPMPVEDRAKLYRRMLM